jgi:hypothetical protein
MLHNFRVNKLCDEHRKVNALDLGWKKVEEEKEVICFYSVCLRKNSIPKQGSSRTCNYRNIYSISCSKHPKDIFWPPFKMSYSIYYTDVLNGELVREQHHAYSNNIITAHICIY